MDSDSEQLRQRPRVTFATPFWGSMVTFAVVPHRSLRKNPSHLSKLCMEVSQKSKATPSSESESIYLPSSAKIPAIAFPPPVTLNEGPAAISTPVCMFLVLTLMGKRPTFGGTPDMTRHGRPGGRLAEVRQEDFLGKRKLIK